MSKKRKPHDPAYMVKQSEMRSHINRVLKSDPLVQKSILEEARRVSLIELEEQEVDIITIFLLSLRNSEKYGRKRLLRVSKVLMDSLKSYKDCSVEDLVAMRERLRKEVSVDVEHLDEEVAEYENTIKG